MPGRIAAGARTMSEDPYIPRLYGRRQDRPLSARQSELLSDFLPKFAFPGDDANPDFRAAMPDASEYWLEIGFGGGEHLAANAMNHPRAAMLGVEPFTNGVVKLLTQIEEKNIENIRIHFGDARPLIEKMPGGLFKRIFVLYPDPWPKKRHFKRRIISPWFLGEAARLLIAGGELRVASDIPDYIRWTLMHAQNEPLLEWCAHTPRDWRRPPPGWIATRYEEKAIAAGRTPAYLRFRRRHCAAKPSW